MDDAQLRREKIRVLCIIAGGIIGMYILFRFVFPVILPFVIAFLLALILSPFVRFLNKRLHIKRSIATLIMMAVTVFLLLTLGNWLALNFFRQLRNFIANFKYYEDMVLDRVFAIGTNIERFLHLKEHTVVDTIRDSLQSLYKQMGLEKMMPAVMDNSMSFLKWLIGAVAVMIVVLVSAFLISNDWEKLKKCASESVFSKEIGLIAQKVSCIGSAYIKTQFILMMITMTICVAGFTIQKNPYSLVVGVLIGFLDALPLIGSGLFFIPWIIFVLLMGNYLYAVGLLIIYLLCYFVRELVEPKLMGQHMGVSSLEMIIAMFLGLELFGFGGLFLGPLGYILLKEILRKPQIT